LYQNNGNGDGLIGVMEIFTGSKYVLVGNKDV